MGPTEHKSSTQSGVRFIYRYFFFNFCFVLALLLSSITLFIGGESWLDDSGSTLGFVGVVVFIAILILLFLIVGFVYIFNGRHEFDSEHDSNVILATILLVVYAILFLITLVYSKGFIGGGSFISAASLGFSSHILELVITLALSIASHIIFGYAMMHLLGRLSSEEQKKRLQTAFYLLVAGNFTLNITGLIAYFMYFKTFQELYLSLKEGKIKAAVTAPCPNCDRDISIESTACPHCGAKLDEQVPIKIDPRLTIEMPKSDYSLPQGYAPIKGPTEAQKKQLMKFILIIAGIVVTVAILYLLIRLLFP